MFYKRFQRIKYVSAFDIKRHILYEGIETLLFGLYKIDHRRVENFLGVTMKGSGTTKMWKIMLTVS